MPVGTAQVRTFGSNPLAAMLARDPDEAHRLVRQVLGELDELSVEDRTILLDTFHGYLDAGGSTDRAARMLHCHPNTVRYRLRRLQQLTGRSVTDPLQLAELTTATYALRVLPEDGGHLEGAHAGDPSRRR